MNQVTKWIARAFLLGLVLSSGIGCNSLPQHLKIFQTKNSAPAPNSFTPEQLVSYLNNNAGRLQAVQCNQVSIDVRQGDQTAPGIEGQMVLQKPRNFRLKGKVVGQPAVDLGSNNEEFWFWVGKQEPPYVFHCNYTDLNYGQLRMPFPFQPEMVIQALGIAEYDPTRPYQVRDAGKNVELIEMVGTPQGGQIQKITVFQKAPAGAGKPQVLSYILRDQSGHDICQTEVYDIQIHPQTGAILPMRMKMVWPKEKVEMTLRFGDFISTEITPDRAAKLFTRADLASLPGFDLAKGLADAPGSGTARLP